MNIIPAIGDDLLDCSIIPPLTLREFLRKLIPDEDILECSTEYGPSIRDCFGEWIGDGVRICFLLDSGEITFSAAGSLGFSRDTQSWIESETLEFKLWLLFDKHLHLDTVRMKNINEPFGWETLTLSWSVVSTKLELESPTGFELKADGFNAPSTLYCLRIVERAKTALEKI